MRRAVQNRVDAIGGAAAGLLGQEGDGIGLVKKPQAALFVTVATIRRIEEDAAAHEDAVAVGHHRGDPAHVEILAARTFDALHAVVDVGLHGLVPVAIVRGVDRIFGVVVRDQDFRLHQQEGVGVAVEHEQQGAGAEADHQGSLWAVDEEAGGQLRPALLAKGEGGFGEGVGGHGEDREDRADRRVDVDVRRAVQGIDGDGQNAGPVEDRRLLHLFGQIGGHAGLAQGAAEHVLGDHIQPALLVAVAVGAPMMGAQPAFQRRPADQAPERAGGKGHFTDGARHGRLGRAEGGVRRQHPRKFIASFHQSDLRFLFSPFGNGLGPALGDDRNRGSLEPWRRKKIGKYFVTY